MDQEKKNNRSLVTASPWLARNRNDEKDPQMRITDSENKIRKSPWLFCVPLKTKTPFSSRKRGGLWVLVARLTITLTQGVGVNATAAQAAIHPPRAALHAINTGGAAGSATPNVNPAPA